MDKLESIISSTIGLIVSVLVVWLAFPLFGWNATPSQSIGVTGLFWALSAVRIYIIRRIFRKLQSEQN